ALLLAAVFSIAQLISGDLQSVNVGEHQPAKLAAFEGVYRTEPSTKLHLFGWPDDARGEVRFGLAIPGLLSFLRFRDFSTPVPGLDQLEATWGRPPVWISFQSFHIMVAIGMLFIAATLVALWYRWRGTLFEQRWLLWFFVVAIPLAFAANELGWVAAEVGRQPWIVYPALHAGQLVGGLRTADAVSETVTSAEVIGSIAMFGVMYLLLFLVWITVLNHKIHAGPKPIGVEPDATSGRDYLEAASRRAGHEESMTEAKE
ncbi:MAG TPA: cytochrome ubiquinol oxidase subunit I, partial [Thermoanaerobaculia bacterium]